MMYHRCETACNSVLNKKELKMQKEGDIKKICFAFKSNLIRSENVQDKNNQMITESLIPVLRKKANVKIYEMN